MTTDKLESHNRLQLSALLDGELHADEARFLLRRLQHDGELNAQWERWQLLGDALRGNALAPAPQGFAARVSVAVAREAEARGSASRSRGTLLRWGGGALAASVAALAVFVALPSHQSARDVAPQVAATPAVSVPAAAVPQAPTEVSVPRIEAPAVAAAPRAIAQVAAPKRIRAEASSHAAPVDVAAQDAASALAAQSANNEDPFAAHDAQPVAKPWPRSLLQRSNSAFNASYDSGVELNEAHPFAPQAPLPLQAAEPQH